jgi:hypothetical protein
MEGYEHVQRVRSRGLKTADLSYQGGRPNIRPTDKLKRPPSRLSNPIECASRQQVLRERTGGCSPDEYFFDDNKFLLRKGDPMGQRLAKVAKEKSILLMMCDSCALERGLAEGGKWPEKATPRDTVEGVQAGCFPDLYAALAGKSPDYIITL